MRGEEAFDEFTPVRLLNERVLDRYQREGVRYRVIGYEIELEGRLYSDRPPICCWLNVIQGVSAQSARRCYGRSGGLVVELNFLKPEKSGHPDLAPTGAAGRPD